MSTTGSRSDDVASWQRVGRIRPEGDTWVVGGFPRTVIEVGQVVANRSLTYVETSETLWRDTDRP